MAQVPQLIPGEQLAEVARRAAGGNESRQLRELSEAISFVYVTHDQDEALTMSDRIAVLADGRLQQVGTPGEIYEQPANEFVAGFVGTSNLVERDGVRVNVRPERIRLLPADEQPPPGMQREVGVVADVVYLGSTTRYVVELERGGTLIAMRQNIDGTAADAGAELGRRVSLVWRPQDAVAIEPPAMSTTDEERET